MTTPVTSSSYTADNIQVLEGLEAVRRRPGMYIGTTDKAGLHHLIKELVDNAVDEAMAGYCDRVEVIFHANGWCTVIDNARGIPVDVQRQTGKTAVETVLTVLHAGGKFGGGGYKVSGGLHGVGVSVVNALSTKLVVKVHLDGKLHQQEYERGVPKGDLKVVDKTDITGTEITFYADDTIFESTKSNYATILDRLRHQAYLTKGVRTSIENQKTGERYSFYFEGGIQSYVKHLNHGKEVVDEDVFYVDKQVND